MKNFELGFSKDRDYNNLTQITFFERFSIILNDDEVRELVEQLAESLNLETRDKW